MSSGSQGPHEQNLNINQSSGAASPSRSASPASQRGHSRSRSRSRSPARRQGDPLCPHDDHCPQCIYGGGHAAAKPGERRQGCCREVHCLSADDEFDTNVFNALPGYANRPGPAGLRYAGYRLAFAFIFVPAASLWRRQQPVIESMETLLQMAIDQRDGWTDEIRAALETPGLNLNAVIRFDYGSFSPLTLMLLLAAEGNEDALSIAKLPVARDDIDVNMKAEHMPEGAEVAYVSTAPLWAAVETLGTTGSTAAAEAARVLLARPDLDVNIRGTIGGDELHTPLTLAITAGGEGGMELAAALLEREDLNVTMGVAYVGDGRRVRSEGPSPHLLALVAAVETTEVAAHEIVRLLLERRDLDVNMPSKILGAPAMTPLTIALLGNFAAKPGALQVVKALLTRDDLDVSCPGTMPEGNRSPLSPLYVAAGAVLNHGGDVDRKQVLWLLAERGARLIESDHAERNVTQLVDNLLEAQAQAQKITVDVRP